MYSFSLPINSPLRRRVKKNCQTTKFSQLAKTVIDEKTGEEICPSLTMTEFQKDCDLNEILRRIKNGGDLPTVISKDYVDVSEVPDFQDAQNYLNGARDAFMSVPAEIRRLYNDSPQNYLNALNDPKQIKFLQKLGYLKENKPAVAASAPANGGHQPADPDMPKKGVSGSKKGGSGGGAPAGPGAT